ncbi:MAG: septal ring lytic transglycosylase RlpA family protein [Gammaproteobacteria bacterium]|nr:septal ring lytic transglycosylase RlpA family protein [Gammaproteobacteria bacterium]
MHRRIISYLLFMASLIAILPPAQAEFESMSDGPPTSSIDVASIPDAIPTPQPLSATGNPPYYDVDGKRYFVLKSSKGYAQEGTASWYGTKFQGKRTSSGEPYNMFAMTAASPNLPIPSFVQVINMKNGKKVVVKVNDRGPFHEGRIIDLSYAAAKKLGVFDHGTAKVKVVAIDTGVSNKLARFYLQVATFKQPNNAAILAKKLEVGLNNKVFVSPVDKTEAVFYRVLIGPLASLEESEILRRMLLAQGLSEGILINKV